MSEDGKVPSDAKINKRILLDPEYEEKQKAITKSKKHMNHIKAVANSFARRGDKITSIASLIKFELSRTDSQGPKYNHIERPD